MKAKVLCYMIQAAIVDENDDGQIINMVETERKQLFTREQLLEHLDSIDELAANRGTEAAA